MKTDGPSPKKDGHTHTHKTLHCAYDFRGLVDSRLMTSGLGSNSGQIPYEKGLFLEFPLRAGVRGTWCNVFYGQRLRDEDRIVLQPLGWPRAAACDVSPTKACWGVGFTYLYKHQVRWKLRYLVTPVLSLEEIDQLTQNSQGRGLVVCIFTNLLDWWELGVPLYDYSVDIVFFSRCLYQLSPHPWPCPPPSTTVLII